MRSRLLELSDYRSIPVRNPIPITGVKDGMNLELRKLLAAYKTTIQPESVQNGDTAILALDSENPKYVRKQLPLTVGQGLFSAELEQKLIGHSLHEKFQAELSNAVVNVTVCDLKRQIYPELTDELLKELGISEEKKLYLAKLHEKVYETRKDETISLEVQRVLSEWIKSCRWDYDEEEVSGYIENYLTHSREELLSKGIQPENLNPREFRRYFGGLESWEELRNFLQTEVRATLSRQLISCELTGNNPNDEGVGEEAVWSVIEAYVRERGVPKEVS